MRNKISFNTLNKIKEEFGDFDIGQIHGGNNTVYLRFGYWKQVNLEILQEIIGRGNVVYEDELYDDDCGWQYSYKLE